MTAQHVFSRISAMEDATVGPEGFMFSLHSSMVNAINGTGYEAVKAKSISLHKNRTQIKRIKSHAPRQTPRPAQTAVLKGWEPFAFPVLLPSLTLFQSLAPMAYLIYRYVINQSIYLSIYIYMCHLFFPSICSLPAKTTFQWMLSIGHILSQETQPPVAVLKTQHLSCLHSFHSIGTQFSILCGKYCTVLNYHY